MSVWIALVVGILIGWIIEWIIDWLYWRRNLAAFYATETQLRRQLATAQNQLAELAATNNALRAEQLSVSAAAIESGDEESDSTEIDSADVDGVVVDEASDSTESDSTEIDAADEDIVEVDAAESDATEAVVAAAVRAAVTHSASTPHPDDLTKISGIGPVYRRKLHDAGIYTFDQLATATPDQLNTAVAPEGFQVPAFEQWIADAGKLVAETEDVKSENERADTPDADEEH